jgi:hypothetical protein
MCCAAGEPMSGSGAKSRSTGHCGEMIGSAGLVQEHEYTLLSAVDNVAGSGYDLILMRNPWGKGEWKGPWGDKSDMWEKHPEVKAALKPEFKDDGKFWISKEDFANNFESISVCLSSGMRKRYDENVKRSLEKELAGFTRHPGCGYHSKFCEHAFISDSEAREMCREEPEIWAGYVQLPPSADPVEEVGVILLKVGGELLSADEGMPTEWTAFIFGEPSGAGQGKRKRQKAKKAAFSGTNPPPPWPQLVKGALCLARAAEAFAQAGTERTARTLLQPGRAAFARKGTIFRPKNFPSRLAPLSTYVPLHKPLQYGVLQDRHVAIAHQSNGVARGLGPPRLRSYQYPAVTGRTAGGASSLPQVRSSAALNRGSSCVGSTEGRYPASRIWIRTPALAKSVSSPTLHSIPQER